MPYTEELYHYGVLGMKWGVRRYQNSDGTLTEAGRKRYLTSDGKLNERGKQSLIKDATKKRERDMANEINKDRLAKNPVFEELTKDVRAKERAWQAEVNKENELVKKFRTDFDNYRKVAAEALEEESKETVHGKPIWEDDGFDNKKDWIEMGMDYYLDVGARDLYDHHYKWSNKGSAEYKQASRVMQAGNEYAEAREKLAKQLVKEIGDDIIYKPTAEELKEAGYSSMKQYMDLSMSLLEINFEDTAYKNAKARSEKNRKH